MANEDKSLPAQADKVEELKESLYSRTSYHEPEDKRTPVEPAEEPEVQGKWDSPPLDEMLQYERRQPEGYPIMKKLFIFAAAFFALAVGIAFYMFLGGGSFVSSKNVDIRVLGPVSASAGDVLELGVVISNKNNADLEVANLSIQYPQGSRDPEDPTKSLSYVREELGEVGAGDEVTRNARIILFGEQGEIQEIKVSVEYKVRGSNATFYKDKVFEVIIGETPVSMSISQPRLVSSGDTFVTTITLTQNSSETVRNIMLRGEYPYGYAVISSSPEAVNDGNLWMLGDMAPGTKKTLTIQGRLLGENEDERTFRFYVGVADPRSEDPKFGTNLVSAFQTVAISRPSIGLAVELNGDRSSTYIAPAGQPISGSVSYQNNLPDKLINPRLEVTLSGASLDKRTVSAQGGFYDSQSNKITWNLKGSEESAEFLPGARGTVFFTFSSLSAGANGEIAVQARIVGTSVGEGERSVSTSVAKTVKISSQITLTAKSLYYTGAFVNKGPVPPKAETETTYTVVFSVGNTQNDISEAKVTASLAPNVKWLASANPDLTYNESSNTITWNLGTLASGTGFSSAPREASFQVSLTPSLSQVGIAPTLVGSIALSGKDTFTSQVVSAASSPVSTRLSSDSRFVQGDDLVVR